MRQRRSSWGLASVDDVLLAFPSVPIVFDVETRLHPSLATSLSPHHVVLYWADDWPLPRRSSARFLRAWLAVPATSSDGVACKFAGSATSLASIQRVVDAGKHVNLYSSDIRLRPLMF